VKQRRIDELLQMLNRKDMLIVSELSRLGRSVGQIITIVDELVKNKVQLMSDN
jgi:DNA invertase Pin-like site-specific DNA recombinase